MFVGVELLLGVMKSAIKSDWSDINVNGIRTDDRNDQIVVD